jgi:hypothetical protein
LALVERYAFINPFPLPCCKYYLLKGSSLYLRMYFLYE